MKVEDFKTILKTLKRDNSEHYLDVKVVKYYSLNRFKVYRDEKCPKCDKAISDSVTIDFFNPIEHLTIFEAQMFYKIFVLNKKPYDYADFHKSPYGKEWIENIKNVVKE